MMIKTLILTLLLLIILVSCSNANMTELSKQNDLNKASVESLIIDYPSPSDLDLPCQEIALDHYRIHDVKISKFYKICNKLGCDFNGDGDVDSIYLLKPVNQLIDESKCYESLEADSSILLIFKNSIGEQKIAKVYKNLFCPRDPFILFEELNFDEGLFSLQRDFGSGNNRKVYNTLFFSWKVDDFYADSIVTEEVEGSVITHKEIFNKTKLSEIKNVGCEYF